MIYYKMICPVCGTDEVEDMDNWYCPKCVAEKELNRSTVKGRIIAWLRWPENKRAGTVPWFVIGWRALWMPLYLTGLAMAWLAVACAYGMKQAMDFWDNAT